VGIVKGGRVAGRRLCVIRAPLLARSEQPCPDDDGPMARATRSPAGASRSTVMAAATTAISRSSMTPMTKRIVRPVQQWLQWSQDAGRVADAAVTGP
jgi:hypothetical protein